MNKLPNLYGIALELNVDYTVHQIKVAPAVSAVHFTIALGLTMKTESCYYVCLRTPDSKSISRILKRKCPKNDLEMKVSYACCFQCCFQYPEF